MVYYICIVWWECQRKLFWVSSWLYSDQRWKLSPWRGSTSVFTSFLFSVENYPNIPYGIVLVKHILYYAVLIALNMSFRSSLYSVWSPVKQFYLCFRKCKCNYRTHSNISRYNSRDTYFDKIMHLLFLDLHFHLWLVPRIFLFCSFTLVYQCSIAVFSEACPFLYSVRFKLYVIS